MTATVCVAGSTGSIGRQALDVLAGQADRFQLDSIGAWSSVEALAEQAVRWKPRRVALGDPTEARLLGDLLPSGVELLVGRDSLAEIAAGADVVVNGVVGFAGLDVTLAALGAGRRLALANKESLIAAAPVVHKALERSGAELVPVDSEHCAIHQCLRSGRDAEVTRLVLTASGGPFRGRTKEQLASVTKEQALAHPTWSMGPKITVDSSTLMNKGLEVIEAHALFGIGFDRIGVVVHPQSVVHSMVQFADGATIAQLSHPDMRLPIGYALGWPERLDVPYGELDWSEPTRLDFEPPDLDAFPCLELAFAAGKMGGSAPAWLNASNEVAVQAFLDGRIAWVDIAEVVRTSLEQHVVEDLATVQDVLTVDSEARAVASSVVLRRSGDALVSRASRSLSS